ncbi:hypothetical protein I4U23_026061 [Adineta vaga]|nr:hypothetical protein I4U23_026061 [Adineta vaga]
MSVSSPPFIDPSAVQWTMATPPPSSAPISKSSRTLDILKVLLSFFIALLLAAILIVLAVVPRSSTTTATTTVDLRASNEKIAQLQRESNENIARLQREYTENLTRVIHEERSGDENKRITRQEDFVEKHRLEDRLIQREQRQQDLSLAMEQLRQHLQIEERRIQILLEDRRISAEHRKEDLSRENSNLLSTFIEEVAQAKQSINDSILRLKIDSLISRLDPQHKSSLISFLYKMKYIHGERSDNPPLDLQGVLLKELDLDDVTSDSTQSGIRLDYNQLILPSTTLINASFQQILLRKSNFSSSNLLGASFHQSDVTHADFSRATLTMTNFRYASATESNFMNVKMQNALFENANLTHAQLTNSDFGSTRFQYSVAIEASFSRSELSTTDFSSADLSRAQMNNISARSANFYSVKAIQTDFSNSYLSNCVFLWADLSSSSFRNAFLAGTNFENANVQNVDFTDAKLIGTGISQGQLDVALSIANTILPDGSRGRNKNLVNNSDAQCVGTNRTTPFWINSGDVFTVEVASSANCLFEGRQRNATLQQRVDIRHYERLIEQGRSKVYIEMQGKTSDGLFNLLDPPVYLNIHFFNSNNEETGQEHSTMNNSRVIESSTIVASFPCPVNTVELQLILVFKEVNSTVDNIYVTME